MSADELRRLAGAMVMVGVRGAEPGDPALERDLSVCAEARVGGVILFDVDLPELTRLEQSGVDRDEARARATRNIISPDQTRALIAHLRDRLGAELIVAVDHEGGSVSRLSPERGFERTVDAATFGALSIADRRREAARLAAPAYSIGFDLNFAPCVDLAVNPHNPIIARKRRAFGDDPDTVIACATQVIGAHRTAGLMTCLKHFPGHGGASADSHVALPDLSGRAARERELAPYQALILALDASTWIMTGHLLERDIDRELPASLSFAHTTRLLRETMKFSGVIVTDSLDMGAITTRWSIEDAAVRAIQAGADIALDGVNAPGERRDCPALSIVQAIEAAAMDGRIPGSVDRLRESANRLRRARRAASTDRTL